MARTEEAVRNAIIGAISATSVLSSLGLVDSSSILAKRLDNYRPEKRAEAIIATIAGSLERKIRAWAVEVYFSEQPRATGGINIRDYTIAVIPYYDPEDINLMLTHSRYVINAIRLLGHNFNSTLASTRSSSVSGPNLVETYIDDIDKYVTMELTWDCYDDIPDY